VGATVGDEAACVTASLTLEDQNMPGQRIYTSFGDRKRIMRVFTLEELLFILFKFLSFF
jgi:hypothetical protein